MMMMKTMVVPVQRTISVRRHNLSFQLLFLYFNSCFLLLSLLTIKYSVASSLSSAASDIVQNDRIIFEDDLALVKLNVRASREFVDNAPPIKEIKDIIVTEKSNVNQTEQITEATLDENNNDSNSDVVSKNNSIIIKESPQLRVSYRGAQVWKFKLVNFKLIGALNDFTLRKEIGWWGGNVTYVDMMVKPTSIDKVRELFIMHNVPYEVTIDDLETAIENENPQYDEELEFANRKGHRMTWQSYHRLSDIHGYLDYLAITYPKLCSVQTIGQSVQGQPLKIIKISNGKPGNKAIWIDGGMHAREWISPASVTYIINQLVEDYENQPDDMKNIDWYIHPVANPDGYEYTHTSDRLWRKNRARIGGYCAGTDLNRNFGYRWGGKGNSRNPCTETYGGTHAFSEPETRSIKNFFDSTQAAFKAYISFHSYGQYILYPWGYDNVVPPDHLDLQRVGQKAAQAMRQTGGGVYRVGSAANTLYPASGGSDDWAKGSRNIKLAYTIELRDSGCHGFVLPSSLITITAKEAFSAIRVIAGAVSGYP